MTKRSAISKMVFIVLVAIIGIVLAVVPFTIPFTVSNWKSFAGAIKLGSDLKGGVYAVYNAELPEGETTGLNEKIEATITRIESLLTSKGYTESVVVKQGSKQIRVEVADVDDPKSIFTIIGEPADLVITDVATFAAIDEKSKVIRGKNIEKVTDDYQEEKYGVSVEFDKEGTKIFTDLTTTLAESKGKLYIYSNGKAFNNGNNALTVESAITTGKTFISGGMDSKAQAEAYAMQILSGTYSVKLSVEETDIISASLGEDALRNGIIAGGIGLLLIFIFMAVYYRGMGLIANLALIFYTILLLFFLSVLPYVQLTLPGIAGIILSLGMAVDGNVIIFERIKSEYRSGKKIKTAIDSGFKKSIMAIVDGNVTTLIAGIILFFVGSGPIKGFAITLLVGIVLSMFTSLLLTKGLLNLSSCIGCKNPKVYGLSRDESKILVDDEEDDTQDNKSLLIKEDKPNA